MSPYLTAAFAIFALQSLTSILAIRWKRNDLADVIWGPGFLVAAIGALWGEAARGGQWSLGSRQLIFLVCLGVWATRLFFYLGVRTLKKKMEDSRYLKMRQGWGAQWVWRSYVTVFLFQGLLMYVISLPTLSVISSSDSSLAWSVIIGAIVWVFGFLFETVGDWQLANFKALASSKGQLMTSGLWSWSRHPNYFGEVTQWWGLYLMVFDLPGAWWVVISPVLLTFLILKVSGIPMLEQLMESRPGFADYKRKTSVFFPLPPRSLTK